jgi:hypothetical protein
MRDEENVGVGHSVNRFLLCAGAPPPAPASPRSSLGPLFSSNMHLFNKDTAETQSSHGL